MYECEPAVPKGQQDAGAVAWLSTQRWQTHHSWCASFNINCWHATSALSLTAGWQWPTTMCQSVTQQKAHVRRILSTLQSLSVDAAKALVQAFISSHLDWTITTRFCTASLITLSTVWTGRHKHITPILRELIGCQLNAVLSSNWRPDEHLVALHRCMCQTSVSWCQTSLFLLFDCTVVCRYMDQDSAGWQVVWCRRSTDKEQVASFHESDFGHFRTLLKADLFDWGCGT